MRWELGFSREASNYAIDSHPYNEDVLIAIQSLALTEEGIPEENCVEVEDNLYLWAVAGHFVLYQQIFEDRRRLWIAVIKPI